MRLKNNSFKMIVYNSTSNSHFASAFLAHNKKGINQKKVYKKSSVCKQSLLNKENKNFLKFLGFVKKRV